MTLTCECVGLKVLSVLVVEMYKQMTFRRSTFVESSTIAMLPLLQYQHALGCYRIGQSWVLSYRKVDDGKSASVLRRIQKDVPQNRLQQQHMSICVPPQMMSIPGQHHYFSFLMSEHYIILWTWLSLSREVCNDASSILFDIMFMQMPLPTLFIDLHIGLSDLEGLISCCPIYTLFRITWWYARIESSDHLLSLPIVPYKMHNLHSMSTSIEKVLKVYCCGICRMGELGCHGINDFAEWHCCLNPEALSLFSSNGKDFTVRWTTRGSITVHLYSSSSFSTYSVCSIRLSSLSTTP